MNEKEFIEREFFIDEEGLIYDNSLNVNLEDEFLKVSKKKIKEIFNKQDEEVKSFLKDERGLN